MAQLTTTTLYCDNCNKIIDSGYPRVRISPTVKSNLIGVFNYTVGTGGYVFVNEDFCSERCFIENIARKFDVKIEIKE